MLDAIILGHAKNWQVQGTALTQAHSFTSLSEFDFYITVPEVSCVCEFLFDPQNYATVSQ